MKYVLTAIVYKTWHREVFKEVQAVNELTEAFIEQRRWLTWWEETGQYEPDRIGWVRIELKIERKFQ